MAVGLETSNPSLAVPTDLTIGTKAEEHKMGDWRDYIAVVLTDNRVEDVAIVGLHDNRAVWASKPGGFLAAICPEEVERVVGRDRGGILLTGVTVGGRRAAVVRDHMIGPEDELRFMDLRTIGSEGLALAVVQTTKTLVFVLGRRGVHAGTVNKKGWDVATYLRRKGV